MSSVRHQALLERIRGALLGGAVGDALGAPLEFLSLDEIRRFPQPADRPGDVLWAGGYPRIYDEHLPAHEWLGNCAPDAPANC